MASTVQTRTVEHLISKLEALLPSTKKEDQPSINFGELFKLYFEQRVKLLHSSPANALYFFKIHGPRWQDIPVNRIERQDVQAWVDELGVHSKSAATRAVNMLSAVINWGRRRAYVLCSNPCCGVEKFKLKARDRFLLPREQKRLLEALREEPSVLRDFFLLCLLTGARKGSVKKMRWDEVDLDLCIWRIPQTKNGDPQNIVLSESAVAVLESRKQNSLQGEWIFPGRCGKGHLQEPKRAWKRILERANINNLTIHDLRRTLASYLAIEGQSPYIIGKALGHRDQRSTAVYARLDTGSVRNAIESVQKKWALPKAPGRKRPAHNRVEEEEQHLPTKPAVLVPAPKLSLADQICVEAKILTALRHGLNTKKHVYSKLGSHFAVNALELQRILDSLVQRGLIFKYRDAGSRDWNCWRYSLSSDEYHPQVMFEQKQPAGGIEF